MSNAKRITELLEITDHNNINVGDLLEIIDANGDPNGNPASRATTLETLYDFLIRYDTDLIRNIAKRYVRVDDDYPDNEGPTFNSLELAVDYARGIINTDGGEAVIKVFFDSNGDPFSTDLTSYTWYTLDPVDDKISVVSGVTGSGTGGLSLTRYLNVDDELDNNSPNFEDVETAMQRARQIISNNSGRVVINLFYDSNGSPLDSDLSTYNWYSEQTEDSSIYLVERGRYGSESNYLKRLLLNGEYNDGTYPFNLEDSELAINLNL